MPQNIVFPAPSTLSNDRLAVFQTWFVDVVRLSVSSLMTLQPSVASQSFSVAGTLRMLGVETKSVTSGAMKDMGSPLKPIDDKDIAVIQKMIDAFYERFLTIVQASRTDIPAESIRTLADGRIYTGQQAKANGLVDDLGYMSDAFELTKTLAKVDRARLIVW